MVLDRLDVERLVAKAHYLAVLARGAHLEAVGQRGALDGERVVAHRLEALREAAEDALAVVGDAARLAVHETLGGDDARAERLRDGLVPEADAEERHLAGEFPYGGERYAGRVRIAGAGREDDRLRLEGGDAREVDLVVADHLHVRPKPSKLLHEVVGERVVVVNHQYHSR